MMKKISVTRYNLPRSGIRELMEYSSKIPDAIHLEVGEPNVDTPLHIREAAAKALNSGFTHYTPNIGLLSLRESLVVHLNRKYALSTIVEEVVVTPGAVNALAVCLLTLVDAGEEVLIPDPGWPNYEQMILSQESNPVRYRLDSKNGFKPDISHLEEVVTKNTRVLLVNTPGNPTGAVLNEDDIKGLLEFASKYDLYVISDEVYDGIVFEGNHLCLKTFDTENRVISIQGFSKNYAMTGWRIGFAVAPIDVALIMGKVLEPIVSCASSVSQKAAEAAITGPQDFLVSMQKDYKERRDIAYEILTEAAIKAYKPQGAFYMLIDMSDTGLLPKDIALTLLKEEKVAVAPGETFGPSSKHMIRISLATETSALIEGVRRICRFVIKYREKNENE